MNSKLILVDTRNMSQEDWLRYRKKGIGASEVGTILGLNPYKCSAQLFYEKLGEETLTLENMAMFLGKEQEAFIADLWQYWNPDDPTEGTLIQNAREHRKMRRCQRVNAYVVNPDFPWLFVSLDRKINKRQKRDIDGREILYNTEDEGALEIKTIAGYEADKWEAGIPPSHVVQVQTQLLVCGFSFGELAILRDGRQFDVIPFEANPDVQETIVRKTREFWDRIEQGRILKTQRFEAERNFNYKAVEEINERLTAVEPPPDGSEAFAKYLKERYKIAEPGEQKGTDEQLEWAERHRMINVNLKELQEREREVENKLKNVLRDGADKIDFGPHGYVSWKVDSRGARRFLNKLRKI
jgi:predicted phage-related endonuclease